LNGEMTGGRKHSNFQIDAFLTTSGLSVDPQAEGRKNAFESFFNTMYPVCYKYALHTIAPKQSYESERQEHDVSLMMINCTVSYLGMALQIWTTMKMRNQ